MNIMIMQDTKRLHIVKQKNKLTGFSVGLCGGVFDMCNMQCWGTI